VLPVLLTALLLWAVLLLSPHLLLLPVPRLLVVLLLLLLVVLPLVPHLLLLPVPRLLVVPLPPLHLPHQTRVCWIWI
jgi:hypothetical protein